MEGRGKDCPGSKRRQGRFGRPGITIILTGILIVALVLMFGTVGSSLTKAKVQKAQKINADQTKMIDWESEMPELNPLLLDKHPTVTDAVEEYYRQLEEEASFVESYDGIQVYTKRGKYKGTYVAFVRYDMKIKDVYTEVPGLSTLYVEEDQKGGCRISTEAEDEQVRSYVQKIAGQEDVQALVSETSAAYQKAVQSDALLQEALTDLKNAYEDPTG